LTAHPDPLITICVPTKNRAWCIQGLLNAFESLKYPKEKIKLVFVDDYSTDETFEMLMEWKLKVRGQCHDIVLIQERTNIPQARNLCAKHMEGKYLLFWDSDVIPPRELLKEMVDTLESNNNIGVLGADYLYKQENVHTRMIGDPVTNRATHAVYMGFTLIRSEVFERIGGFNELLDVGEDTEFGIRVAEKTSYKILWAPRPVLHLKHVGETKGCGRGFVRWLSYNFHVRGKKYAESFPELPQLLRLRIFYYALLPPLIVFLSLLAYSIGLMLVVLVFVAYLLPALFLNISGSTIRKGVISFFVFNVPTGVMLSYGFLLHIVKKSLKESKRE